MKLLTNKAGLFLSVLSLVIFSGLSVSAQTSSFDQKEIEKQVRKELVTLPRVGVFDNLAYEVKGDTVTLFGQVVEPSSKKSAERDVARIEGVKTVVNNIEVLPFSSFGNQIRVQAYRRIANIGGLYRYLLGANPSMRIIVNNGNITLEGFVANKTDGQLATIAANQVFGVFSVKNNLIIENDKVR